MDVLIGNNLDRAVRPGHKVDVNTVGPGPAGVVGHSAPADGVAANKNISMFNLQYVCKQQSTTSDPFSVRQQQQVKFITLKNSEVKSRSYESSHLPEGTPARGYIPAFEDVHEGLVGLVPWPGVRCLGKAHGHLYGHRARRDDHQACCHLLTICDDAARRKVLGAGLHEELP